MEVRLEILDAAVAVQNRMQSVELVASGGFRRVVEVPKESLAVHRFDMMPENQGAVPVRFSSKSSRWHCRSR